LQSHIKFFGSPKNVAAEKGFWDTLVMGDRTNFPSAGIDDHGQKPK